ncbi:MAG: diaminopimelate decarboxylase [Defluviitaleaceae bacterium]|nr:diaminopimelate decarboxylase [Defluviitaleaceae bacterium]
MTEVTDRTNFFEGHDPRELVAKYGSPLYVYSEKTLRLRCREMVSLSSCPNVIVNYAVKANTNLTLLKIARECGCRADISSMGEAVAAMEAGFRPDEMLFMVNNVSADELSFAVEKGITVCVDSLTQLATLGRLNPGGKVAVRFNSGVGGGHHENVVTGGDGTKFGIMPDKIAMVKLLAKQNNLKIAGITHHIGSQNWGDLYLAGVDAILKIAREFSDLEFIDFGGGFAIPYNKQNGEKPLDLRALSSALDSKLFDFNKEYGKSVNFIIEPGRYIAAECGVLLGTVHSVKSNNTKNFAGTDLGFSVFKRPTVYDAHHDIEIYRGQSAASTKTKNVNIVGNQCESGDYIAKERELPELFDGDIIGVLDAGAYGYSMSCQYNFRPRPAEVLIQLDKSVKLIRRRDNFTDMLANMVGL